MMHKFFNTSIIKHHLFLGLLLLHTAHIYASMTYDQKMITGCVIFAGITSYCRKPLTHSKIIQKIAKKTNTNAQDIADILPLSALTWAASHLTTNLHKQRALRYGAIVAPCVMALTTHPTFNKYTSYLFGCTNAQCKGICDECKTGQIYKALPFKVCVNYFYDPFATFIMTILGMLLECEICMTSQATANYRCSTCNSIACDTCIIGWIAQAPTCPGCRRPITGNIVEK